MKKPILISLIAIVLVIFVVLSVLIFRESGKSDSKDSGLGNKLTTEQRGEIVKEQQLKVSAPETTFNGVVGSVTSPKGLNVKILEVDGTIEDIEALENMRTSEFAGESVSIPTMKKTFKVAVDENTKLLGFDSLDDIKSGDQVKVDAGQDPRKAEEFTAIRIELNFRNQ